MIGKGVRLGMGTGMGMAVGIWLLLASPTMASRHHLTGEFAVFADCPLNNPAVTRCIVANFTGELILGKKTVQIDKTLTLQGGLIESEPESEIFKLAAPEDGDTLSKTVISVPGGLLGMGHTPSTTMATVVPELAGPASSVEINFLNLGEENGVGLRLPIKAKLNNILLGGNCYVGSAPNPIVLNLTDGTTSPPAPNKPIKGVRGKAHTVEEDNNVFLRVFGSSLVDNAFAAPAATGCGSYYSPLVSSDIGLPSPAGHNTVVLTGKIELATTEAVRASE